MKRLRLIVMVVAVMVMGVVAIACFRAREPRYQGRTLSDWINSVESTQDVDPDRQAASHAIKQMAAEAIPVLLKWVQSANSPQMQKLIDWSQRHPSIHFMLKDAELDREKAYRGFGLLGNEAKPAWPTFIQWTYSTNTERRAWGFWSLARTNPDKETLLPVLQRLIHDPDTRIQLWSARVFHQHYPEEAEAAGIHKMIPKLNK